MISNPTVETLLPTLTASGGAFNGEAFSFPTGDILEVWFKYDKGATLPVSSLQTPRQRVTAIASGTLIPSVDAAGACLQYSYKVGNCRYSSS